MSSYQLIRISLAQPTVEGGQRQQQLTWNPEKITAILVCEHIVELVETRPRNTTQTQRTGLVGREEDAILGFWPSFLRELEELLDAIDLAVQQWRLSFIIRLCNDCR